MENILSFCGKTYEEAFRQVISHFHCEPWMLSVQRQDEENSVTLFAEYISPESLIAYDKANPREVPVLPEAFRNSSRFLDGIRLHYKDDGVYLQFVNPVRPQTDTLRAYLTIKKVSGFNLSQLDSDLLGAPAEIKIAPPQEELFIDEDLEITKDDMEARAVYLPGEPKGNTLNIEMIIAKLNAAGIVRGIDVNALYKMYYQKRYDEVIVIARGMPAANGKDAQIEYKFRVERDHKPKIMEDGSVDYKNLNLIENVKKDDVLAIIHPETQGLDGYTVQGKTIWAINGKKAVFPRGKNTEVSEDKRTLTASCDGSVDIIGGKISVANVLEFDGDIDANTGNIDFDGALIIKGNVLSGFSVKASGNIDIYGVVEAATVISGGNINLRQGVHGMNACEIYAEGDVVILFAENANIFAGGSVHADVIRHSTVSSGNAVIAKGKYGTITGGRITAAKLIAAERTASPNSSTLTVLEVGMPPELRKRSHDLEKEIAAAKADLTRVKLVADRLELLDRMKQLSVHQVIQKVRVLNTVRQLEIRIANDTKEHAKIMEMLEAVSEGSVHVKDEAYSFTTIIIGSSKLRLDDTYKYSTFKRIAGEIAAVTYCYSGK